MYCCAGSKSSSKQSCGVLFFASCCYLLRSTYQVSRTQLLRSLPIYRSVLLTQQGHIVPYIRAAICESRYHNRLLLVIFLGMKCVQFGPASTQWLIHRAHKLLMLLLVASFWHDSSRQQQQQHRQQQQQQCHAFLCHVLLRLVAFVSFLKNDPQ